MPLLAGGAGICAAAAFIASSNGEMKQGEFAIADRVEVRDGEGEPWRHGIIVSLWPIMVKVDGREEGLNFNLIRKEGSSDDGRETKEGLAEASGTAAGGAPARKEPRPEVVPPETPRSGPDPALVARGEELRSRLTPEQKDAIEKWINMSESDKKGLILLNVLVCIVFVGLALAASILFIIHFEINPFDMDTWRNLPQTLQKVSKSFNSMHLQTKRSPRSAEL
mmetsp:Transcript_46426/g.105894  ORF Transcript_46426/g.105894 Transcript_46426/m.105894 type:complete len:223 (+) Transcript_46426:3-671(+)